MASSSRITVLATTIALAWLHGAGDRYAAAVQWPRDVEHQPVHPTTAHSLVQLHDVQPLGWRRTVHGWEHSATWPQHSQGRQLQHWIHVSQKHESPRVMAALTELQRLHPLMYACCLLGFTAMVTWVSRLRRSAVQPRSSA